MSKTCNLNEFYVACNEENIPRITELLYNHQPYAASLTIDKLRPVIYSENYNVINCLIKNGVSQHHVCFAAIRCGKINVLEKFVMNMYVNESLVIAIENKYYDVVDFVINNKQLQIESRIIFDLTMLNKINVLACLLSRGFNLGHERITFDALIDLYNNGHFEIVNKIMMNNECAVEYCNIDEFNRIKQYVTKINLHLLTQSLIKHRFFYDLVIKTE